MATTLTKNLKLKIDSNLTANAKYNLNKIDELGAVYQVDNTGDVRLRSKTDIVIQPEDSSVGGSGTGGTVTIGSEAAPVESFVVHADTVEFANGLALSDITEPGTESRLYLEYDSSLSGTLALAQDYTLSLDVDGANRRLLLGTDVSIVGPGVITLQTTADTNLVLPVSGEIVTTTSTQTLTNKTIDGFLNSLSNIPGSAIVPNGNIPYSALNLANSVKNSDISGTAAIAYSKLNLSLGIKDSDVSPTAAIQYTKLNLTNGIKDSDVAPAASISYGKLSLFNSVIGSDIAANANIGRSKLAAGTPNAVLVNDGSGRVSEAALLATQFGGTGQSGNAVFPATGTILTDTNNVAVTNKTINGSLNTLSNIGYSSLVLAGSIQGSDIAANANIGYSKLALSGSIVNADVSPYAAISGAKVVPDFNNQEIRTSGGLRLDGQTYSTRFHAASGNTQASELDFYFPASSGVAGNVLTTNGNGQLSWNAVTGTGTVTSVGLQAPNDIFNVTGSPVTVSGTLGLNLNAQAAKSVWAGPVTGSAALPAFRALQLTDLPSLTASRAVTTSASGTLATSTTTDVELGYVSGVTSPIQTQLGNKQPLDGDLTAISALTTTGFAARVGSDTWLLRNLVQGTGISIANADGVSGNPTVTNTAPDQVVSLANGTAISVTGTYPSFTVTNTAPDQVVSIANGTSISVTGTYPSFTVTNTAPDKVVTLTQGAGVSITGTYPSFTIASTVTQYTDAQAQNAVGSIVQDSADIDFTYTANTSLTGVLQPTGVTAGTKGSASVSPVFVVDSKGRITSASPVSIAIAPTQVTGFNAAAQDAVGSIATNSTSVSLAYVSATSLTATVTPGTIASKATPVAADIVLIGDSAASNAVKTVSISALSAAIAPQSFKANWVTTDGTTKTVTHNLGSLDVIIQIYDTTLGDTIQIDSTVRTNSNTVTLTSSQAPSASWRILILKV